MHRISAVKRTYGAQEMTPPQEMRASAPVKTSRQSSGSSHFEVRAFDRPSLIEPEWRQLEATGCGTVFQRYDWVDAYVRHVLPHENARASILLGRLDGEPAFILPLAISKTGPVRIARWIGGKHTSYNFGLWSREGAARMRTLSRSVIERILGKALGNADCALLGQMPRCFDDIAQPLGALSSIPCATEGYAFALSRDFDALLQDRDGRNRRKRVKAKERKMGAAGEVRYQMLLDPAEEHAALDFFFEQKALRLAEQGKPNSFAEPGVTAFFHDLIDRSIGTDEPLLEIASLSVDGKTRAVTGSGIYRGHMNSYFTAFALDELAQHSPGNVLTFRHIEHSCERGMTVYDLGIGYEDYKTHWCDIIHELDDAYAVFTPLGSVAVSTMRLGEAVKDRIRRNRQLWQSLKTVKDYVSRRLSR